MRGEERKVEVASLADSFATKVPLACPLVSQDSTPEFRSTSLREEAEETLTRRSELILSQLETVSKWLQTDSKALYEVLSTAMASLEVRRVSRR